ncbi:MAG: type II toxin-antitoxin system Phd/YefM family antitoxin [Candidatus Omnitrophota bacterium]
MATISLSEAKDKLSKLVKETAETTEPLMISVHGRKEVVMISMEEYAGLTETIEILKDHDLVRKIQAGLQEVKKGQLVDFDSIKKDV